MSLLHLSKAQNVNTYDELTALIGFLKGIEFFRSNYTSSTIHSSIASISTTRNAGATWNRWGFCGRLVLWE